MDKEGRAVPHTPHSFRWLIHTLILHAPQHREDS